MSFSAKSRLLATSAVAGLAVQVFASPVQAQDAFGLHVDTPERRVVLVETGETVYGEVIGVYADNGPVDLTVEEGGTIRGNGIPPPGPAGQAGVRAAGGVVIAQPGSFVRNSGVISGAANGISTTEFFGEDASGNPLDPQPLTRDTTIVNTQTGSIVGEAGMGVALIGGGSVINDGYIRGSGKTNSIGVIIAGYPNRIDEGVTGIGIVTNASTGTIEGGVFGVLLSGGGTIDNAGTIRSLNQQAAPGSSPFGVILSATAGQTGRVATVNNSGTISGLLGMLTQGPLTQAILNNSGTIGGQAVGIFANTSVGTTTINNLAGGSITGGAYAIRANTGKIEINNATGARITSNTNAIEIVSPGAAIDNTGLIEGGNYGIVSLRQSGLLLPAGTSINNTGTIVGRNNDGVRLPGGGTVVNSGTISGISGSQSDGVSMFAHFDQSLESYESTVINLETGSIYGARFGVILSSGGEVANEGQIQGVVGGVLIQGTFNDGEGNELPGQEATVSNSGLIIGEQGAGVGFQGNLATASLINSGIISSQSGAAVHSTGSRIDIDNSGALLGSGLYAVTLAGGNDSITLRTGSQVSGIIDGSDGYDRAFLNGSGITSSGQQQVASFENFEELNVEAGYWTAAGATGAFETINISGGTLLLTGSIAGDVTTNEGDGYFQLGKGGTEGTFTGNLVNNGTFVFNRSDNYDFTGAFSGNGLLRKEGAGTLAFLGTYNFIGTTQLKGGGIKINGLIDPKASFDLSAGSILDLSGSNSSQTIGGLSGPSGASVVLGTGGLTVNQTTNSTYGGDIGGNGSLTKTGDGNLNLTGNSTYTGSTQIYGGILSVNGSIVSPVTVYSGGTLGGTGTTGTVTVAPGGTYAPGNSIGTITTNGDLTFGRGSIYAVEVNAAGQSDRINTSGTVTIHGATVNVIAANQVYNTKTEYTILTGAKINGSFTGVTSNLAFLKPSLNHSKKSITLTLKRNDKEFASVAQSANQASAAIAATQLGPNNPIVTGILALDAADARSGFAALAGEVYANLSNSLVGDAAQLRSVLALNTAPDKGIATFSSAFSAREATATALATQSSNLSQSDTAGGYTAGTGIALGEWKLSVVSGRTGADQLLGNAGESAVVRTQFFGGNVAREFGKFSAKAGAGIAWHDVQVNRMMAFGGFSDAPMSRLEGSSRQSFAELGYALAEGRAALAPYAALTATQLSLSGVSEQGGAAALTVGEMYRETYSAKLGLRGGLEFATLSGWGVKPMFDVGIQRNFGDLLPITKNTLAGSESFLVAGDLLAKTSVAVEAGVEVSRGLLNLAASYRNGGGGQTGGQLASIAATLRF